MSEEDLVTRCPYFTNQREDRPHYGCDACDLYEMEDDEPALCVHLHVINHKGWCEHPEIFATINNEKQTHGNKR